MSSTSQLRAVRDIMWTLYAGFSNGTLTDGNTYNVYTEADMRSGETPVFPYVYLVEAGNLFEVEHLPVIVVQPTFSRIVLGLGGQQIGLFCELNLHVYARDNEQMHSIAGAIGNMLSFTKHDFTDHTNPVPVEEIEIIEDSDGNVWTERDVSINDSALAIEGSLLRWTALSCAMLMEA